MFDPCGQTVLKLFSVENAEHATKRVVGRDPKRQFEKLLEPALMSFAEAFNIGPRIRPADCAAKHEPHHINQQMIVTTILARVFQIDKVCKKFKIAVGLHRSDSVLDHKNAAKQFCHLTRTRFMQNSNRYGENQRAIALIRGPKCSHVFRSSVDHAQTVQVTTILRRKSPDKRRPPVRKEAVFATRSDERDCSSTSARTDDSLMFVSAWSFRSEDTGTGPGIAPYKHPAVTLRTD